ncbi:unnamed protein product [Pseudo-nitzschia multistriata]|uniref:Uncharacterized protein n=1 Tax=Pseudo-nitzschia multistriata TaxID=183589 RepID=A0A448ZFT5_9STRA|nr:unnamed protein product [Pseudo-nitzschia multistriata]
MPTTGHPFTILLPSLGGRRCGVRVFQGIPTHSVALLFMIALLALSGKCRSEPNATLVSATRRSPYLMVDPKPPPPDCHRTLAPAYFLETTREAHTLVVELPQKVSRKNLGIDVDYQTGSITVLGWWSERKIRGEAPRKMCVHHMWRIDPSLMTEEAVRSEDSVSVYDLVMSLRDQRLVLSLPVSKCTTENDGLSPPAPPPSPIVPSNHTERIDRNKNNSDDDDNDSQLSIIIAYGTTLWKQLRGLSRLKELSRHYSNLPWDDEALGFEPESGGVGLQSHPQNSLAYLRSRQVALEHFLTRSMGVVENKWY